MPAILSVVVLLIALYCFWLFMQTATPQQMGRMMGVIAALAFAVGMFYLVATRRLPLALGILIALWPLMAACFDYHWKNVIKRHPPEQLPPVYDPDKEKIKNDFDQSA